MNLGAQQERGEQFVQEVVSAMQSKKGQSVVCLDLRSIEKAVCDYFVICSADTPPHIRAISDEVEVRVAAAVGEWPWRASGREGALWVVMDYIDVVVHVMTNETRAFYQLESLWSDAKRIDFADKE